MKQLAPSPSSPAVLVWAAGALVLLLRLVAGMLAVRRLVRRSAVVADHGVLAVAADSARHLGLHGRGRRAPVLRVSDDVAAPVTVGVLHAQVLLPRDALSWPRERLRLALVHEFAHARRRDVAADVAARCARALHWPNPLAWVAVARLGVERERACDDAVLASGSGPHEYAGFLVSLARSLARSPRPAALAAAMAGGPRLEDRVRAILDGGRRRRAPSLRASVALTALAALPLAFAACVRPTEATAPRDDGAAAASVPPPAAAETTEAPAVVAPAPAVTVAKDGTGQFATISAAVAAAPEGATVRIGPGVYEEQVLVTRTLTLEGAGADRTTILARDPASMPALRVANARGVVVRDLTIAARGTPPQDTHANGAVVHIAVAGVRMERTAVVGGPATGVGVEAGSDLDMERCLVAGVFNRGVGVAPAGDAPTKVRIADSDLRNCRYCGVSVAPGNRDVTIERCRISGSSWHGIRYDDAAPVIRGNRIERNLRSGIYASGKTGGRIEGNLFVENGMSDVSCWFEAGDTVEGNTFVRSQREAVAILGASRPVVRRNVFFECATAFMAGSIADDRAARTPAAPRAAETDPGDGPVVAGNVLWRCGTDFTAPLEGGKGVAAGTLPAGNVSLEPGFADAAKGDWSLPEGSAARAAGAGAAAPLTAESPWAPRPEEDATRPTGLRTPAAERSAAAATPRANADAMSAVERAKADILQIRDPAQRERGLAALGEAMDASDPNVAAAALRTLYAIRDAQYDKARFRPQVLRQLASKDATVRIAAAYALVQVKRNPGDLDLVLAAAESEPVPPGALLHVAMMLAGGRVEGRLAALFVKALAVDDPRRGAMDTANYLRGMSASPEVEDAVVAAWRRHPDVGGGHGLWPYILGQIASPARESRVRAILELLATGDESARQLTERAVTRAVDPSARALTAQLASQGLETAPTASFRATYIEILRANGGPEQVPALRALADNPMLADDVRAQARKVADQLEAARVRNGASDEGAATPIADPADLVLEIRTGAQGGNPSVVSLAGATRHGRVRLQPAALDMSAPPSMRDEAVGFVKGGAIPKDRALVIESADVYGLAKGDSNGHGEVVVKVGPQTILRLADGEGPARTWLTGRAVVLPGEEDTVSLQVANSCAAEVRLHGRFVPLADANAVERVPFRPDAAPAGAVRAAEAAGAAPSRLLAEPRAFLQVRASHSGGNPVRVSLLGKASIYVDRMEPGRLLPFSDVPERVRDSLGHVEGGVAPRGKAFAVTRIEWSYRTSKDGTLLVSVMGKEIVRHAQTDGEASGSDVWTGRIVVPPGSEEQVFVEASMHSGADVTLTGEFVDAPAGGR